MAKIKLIEIHSDLGGRIPGASMGPDAVRIASYKNINDINFYDRFQNELHTDIKVPNKWYHNDTKYPFAKSIDKIYPTYLQTCDVVANSIIVNDFTIVISGDHSSSGGVIGGIKQAFHDSKIGIV
jgi:arginase